MNYYFKVFKDFNNYIPIEANELEKALYAFQTGKAVIFDMGAVTRIESIIPDVNKSLGWYSDYKPTADDNGDIDKIRGKYGGYISATKEKIQYLISQGKTDMIGKNIDVPELKKEKIENRRGGMKSIGDITK